MCDDVTMISTRCIFSFYGFCFSKIYFLLESIVTIVTKTVVKYRKPTYSIKMRILKMCDDTCDDVVTCDDASSLNFVIYVSHLAFGASALGMLDLL